MTNREAILEFLEANSSEAFCDDCLSERLRIEPRQTVNQLCNGLAYQKKLTRSRRACSSCGKNKLCNAMVLEPAVSASESRPPARERGEREGGAVLRFEHAPPVGMVQDPRVEIVGNWQRVLRFCRHLWEEQHGTRCSLGLSDLINELEGCGLLRQHEVIMMHTIRRLRNECLYDAFPVRAFDARVSTAALEVIALWARSAKPEVWQRAETGTNF